MWRKMFHYFQFNKEEFLQHYHQRSDAESAFKTVKMKFGDKLKAKNFIAQKNELFCKLIAHNIVYPVQRCLCWEWCLISAPKIKKLHLKWEVMKKFRSKAISL